LHKTRLHDEKENLLPLTQLRYLPRNVHLTVRRRLMGALPDLPWIPFNAIERLEACLRSDWRMIEFGSGMSTAWYARRVAYVHSIESDSGWYQTLANTLPGNVRYELRSGPRYWDLDEYEDRSLDFAVIDGIARDQCVNAVLPKLRSGGWIYLDNSDKDMTVSNGHVRLAESAIRQAARAPGGEVLSATGLTVGMLVAQEWLLARVP
jgi:hypothetical protein